MFNLYIMYLQFTGGSSRYYIHAPDAGLVSMLIGETNQHVFYHFDAVG